MRKDVIDYVLSCNECQSKKKPTPGLMLPIIKTQPFEMIGIDFLGRFKLSESGNTYIIVATDYFTKWAIVKAIATATKEHAADFLIEEVICKHGAFKTLLSDRGVQFRSQLSQAIYDRLAIKHVTTTSFRPSTNGLCEKYNQTLAKMMTAYCNKSQDLWDKHLQWITFAFNTSIHASTGFSAFRMLYGRDPVLPPDRILHTVRTGVESEDQYLRSLDQGIKEMYRVVNNNVEKAAVRNKYYYDKRHRDIRFNVGDKVLVYYPTRYKGLTEKLLTPFHGPFTITKCHPNGLNYDVQGIRNGKKLVVDCVHVSRLKKYYDREDLIARLESLAIDSEDSQTSIAEYSGSDDEGAHKSDTDQTIIYTDDSSTEMYDYEAECQQPLSPVIDPTHAEAVESPAEPTSQMPRRSQRLRQPRKMYPLLTFFILCLCLLSTVMCSFQKLNPIIWRKSSQPVVTGINRVLINAKYSSPCDIFLDQSFVPLRNEDLKAWCDKEFSISFIEPLRKFCKNPYHMPKQDIVLKRQKRLTLLAAGIIGIFAVAITTTVGLTTHAIIQNKGLKEKIQVIQEKFYIFENGHYLTTIN
jgi:hypothetical protein